MNIQAIAKQQLLLQGLRSSCCEDFEAPSIQRVDTRAAEDLLLVLSSGCAVANLQKSRTRYLLAVASMTHPMKGIACTKDNARGTDR